MSTTTRTGSLMVVHFVEPQLAGWDFERPHWPLHITLVPWFTVDDEEVALRTLERVAGSTPAMTLEVGDEENFGVNRDVLVNVIEDQTVVKALHRNLIKSLTRTDTTFDKQGFIGQKFIAHVTRHAADMRHSNAGEKILLNDFHLVRLTTEKTCHVERQFKLDGVA